MRGIIGKTEKKLPENVLYGKNFVVGDVISILLNLDSGTLEFWKNGVSQGISHTNIKTMGEVFPAVSAPQSGATESTVTANFGASSFVYPMPKGFSSFDCRQRHWDSRMLFQTSTENRMAFYNKFNTITAIPKMTSNITPSGRAFAKDIYSTSYDAWKAFNQVDDTEGYASKTGSGGVGFLGYEFDKPIAIAKYAVRSMAGSSHLNKLPRDWTFEGSHDGEKWHVLDTQKNQTWTTVNTDKDYYVDIPKSYKMYRLNWSANNGFTGYTDVNELKMYRGVNVVSHIPTVSEKYFTAYGMDKIAQETLKNNYDKVQLISNKESELNEGKIFEHEIDLKKYEVNKLIMDKIEGKSLILTSDVVHLSFINSASINYISYADEHIFRHFGMGKSVVIDLEKEFKEKVLIEMEANTVGIGKVFKQRIDPSKIPIKQITII